jgi:hypothetical protein
VLVAADENERALRTQRLGAIESTFDPLSISADVAREWGRLAAAVSNRGDRPRRRAIDLAIAATAICRELARRRRRRAQDREGAFAARCIKEDIERQTGHRTWVQAVVVFWSEFPDGLVDDGRCIFVHGPRLHALMQGRPNRLSKTHAEEIASAITCIADRESSEDIAPVSRELSRA